MSQTPAEKTVQRLRLLNSAAADAQCAMARLQAAAQRISEGLPGSDAALKVADELLPQAIGHIRQVQESDDE